MALTFNLSPELEKRLYESGKRAGLSPEEAERRFAEAVQEPSIAEIIGALLYLFVMQSETQMSPEKQEEFRPLLQPIIDRILRHGTPEEWEALLPKIPVAESPTIGQEILAEWQQSGVIGSRPDITDSQAHARTLRKQAQRRERTS